MRDEAEYKGDSEAGDPGGRRCRDAQGVSYLPPTRDLRERLDTAQTLSRLFYAEQALVLWCGESIPQAPRLEAKAELAQTAWESALAGDALRERVFELRYPSRFLDDRAEPPHAVEPDAERIRDEYRAYLEATDPLADGPSIRIVAAAVRDKERQVETLAGVELTGGRDDRYLDASFYWPDVLDPDYPYGEGVALQVRSAVSHLNEVWAVDTAARILHDLSPELGWEFTRDAARWLYDETRHMLMGKERLDRWGLSPGQIPLGGYIYEAWQGEDALYGLGMLGYFETKNIGRKRERARAFEEMGDRTSETHMEFDWADETLHAEYGRRWLRKLLETRGQDPESWPEVLERCERLVRERISQAVPGDLERIRAAADELVRAAEERAAVRDV